MNNQVVDLKDAGHAPLDSRVNVAKLLKDADVGTVGATSHVQYPCNREEKMKPTGSVCFRCF